MNEPVEQPQTQEAGEDHPAEKLRALIDRIEDALDVGKLNRVEKTISKLHSADVADLLEQLHPDDRKTVIDIIRPQLSDDPEFLTYVDDEIRDEIVALLHPEEVASAIAEMESDDAVALVEDLDKEEREEILSNLPTSARLLVEEGLSFPEDSAGRLMQREMVAVPMFWTVGKTID
ncbi:MAG: magnesium transporter, partial [Pseudomonadota bacterium]